MKFLSHHNTHACVLESHVHEFILLMSLLVFVPPYKYTEENFVCMFQYVSICFNIDKSKILQPTLTSLYIYIKLQQFRTLIYPNKITLEREYLFWVNGTKIIMPSPISP